MLSFLAHPVVPAEMSLDEKVYMQISCGEKLRMNNYWQKMPKTHLITLTE